MTAIDYAALVDRLRKDWDDGSTESLPDAIAAIERLTQPVCKCDLRTKAVGDGCQVCNPELAEQIRRDNAEDLHLELTQPGGEVEQVGYFFQHEDTGLITCMDVKQAEWFEKNNPRHVNCGAVYSAATVARLIAERDATQEALKIARQGAEFSFQQANAADANAEVQFQARKIIEQERDALQEQVKTLRSVLLHPFTDWIEEQNRLTYKASVTTGFPQYESGQFLDAIEAALAATEPKEKP